MSPDVRGNSLRKITLTNLFNMKFKLPKALLAAMLVSSAAYAAAVTEVVESTTTSLNVYTTETTGSTYTATAEQKPSGSSYGMRFKKNLVATNSTFTTADGYNPFANGKTGNVAPSGSMWFDGNVEATNCKFIASDYSSGSIKFVAGKKVALKGGNTFQSRSGQNINFLGTVTAEGDNEFIGGISAVDFVVKSGTQKFTREDNPSNYVNSPSQALSFTHIGFADDADETARIDISAVDVPTRTVDGYSKGGAFGAVRFGNSNNEITSLEVKTNLGLYINGALTVRETVTIGSDTQVNFGENGVLIFEIDSIYELMERPSAQMMLTGDADTMLNVADGVDMSNAKVELLFTENAVAELSAIEGPVTLNLNKVTNLENIELSLAVEESLGKTSEEVFGTTSVTTGAAGSDENLFTITVPEPTTATLSLLALASLAMRRRRK